MWLDGHDRDVGDSDDFFRDASNNDVSESGSPVRCHNDKVNSLLFREAYDFFGGWPRRTTGVIINSRRMLFLIKSSSSCVALCVAWTGNPVTLSSTTYSRYSLASWSSPKDEAYSRAAKGKLRQIRRDCDSLETDHRFVRVVGTCLLETGGQVACQERILQFFDVSMKKGRIQDTRGERSTDGIPNCGKRQTLILNPAKGC